MDGDGQMDPANLVAVVHPIASGLCNFTKGNRFVHLESLRAMPFARWMENVGLMFLRKSASGHWHFSDPTKGFPRDPSRSLEASELQTALPRILF